MSTATNGRAREYIVRDHMASLGWTFIMRSAGSKGPADLVMAHPVHGVALVQVGSRSKQLGPGARERFLYAAELCSALPLLAVVIPRRGITYWHVTAAPASRWDAWSP